MIPAASQSAPFQGNDRVLYGIILGVITFWLFAQTTLNITPDMGRGLGLGASTMNRPWVFTHVPTALTGLGFTQSA